MPNNDQNPAPKETYSREGITQDLPPAFSGWNKLFVNTGKGEPIPPGWKTFSDQADAPGKALPTTDVSGSQPSGFQTMISEHGDTVRIAADKVKHAVNAGLYKAVHMVSPNGVHGWIPEHRVEDAKFAGFTHAAK